MKKKIDFLVQRMVSSGQQPSSMAADGMFNQQTQQPNQIQQQAQQQQHQGGNANIPTVYQQQEALWNQNQNTALSSWQNQAQVTQMPENLQVY